MTPPLKAIHVFTPNSVPTVTYVDRGTLDLETKLRRALETPGVVTSISGPSKTGKTVLVKTVLHPDALIPVSGASVRTAEDLWSRVLNWMDVAIDITTTEATSDGVEMEGKASGSVGLPLIGKLGLEGGGKKSSGVTAGSSHKIVRTPIDQVVHEIAASEFTIFIDDFHYMENEIQVTVARQIKEVAEKGVRVCTASVPHRSDDVVRSNTELRGRVQSVDVGYWRPEQIIQIAEKGFKALNVEIEEAVKYRFAAEAFGSPQLMQSICLQTCFLLDIEEKLPSTEARKLSAKDFRKVLERTSTTTDFSTIFEIMHKGPKLRGQDRNQYALNDGSTGDVYRAVLLAMRADPPAMTFRYDEILLRVRQCCGDAAPVGSSVSEALKQMDALTLAAQPGVPVIEWSEDVLDIVDPYFLFYLRSSELFQRLVSPEK